MTTRGITSEDRPSRIPVSYLILGFEANRDAIINFYRNANRIINWVTNEETAQIASQLDWLETEIRSVRERGVLCRTISDITMNNIAYCKMVINRIDELRHLGGIKAVFAVSDREAMAMVPSTTSDIHEIQFIHSESESVLEHKRQVFDTLWRHSRPAEPRIAELERGRGLEPAEQTPLKKVIDSIYVCNDCGETFIFSDEVNFHKNSTGHLNIKELSLS